MMLVNASTAPGEFFKETIGGLCTGTIFEFSAYVINVLKPTAAGNKPNLTFIIESTDGTELGKYSTGNILETPSPEGKKYGMIFTTPVGISQVTLKIINNAPGGNGNDLAIDDITFRACGPVIEAKINGGIVPVSLCEGEKSTILLSADVSAGYNAPAYQWQISIDNTVWTDIPGGNTKNLTVTIPSAAAGGYKYRLTVAEQANIGSVKCRALSEAREVVVIDRPTVDAGPDKSFFKGIPAQLDGKAGGNDVSYLWSPPNYLDDPTKLNPLASPPVETTYTLEVTNACNVTVRDEMVVKVYLEIKIPNTFSPNGDGVNDVWNIGGLISYSDAIVKIFNRYGDLVYTSRGYDLPWDGKYDSKTLPVGTYYYLIDLKTGEKSYSGPVTILE